MSLKFTMQPYRWWSLRNLMNIGKVVTSQGINFCTETCIVSLFTGHWSFLVLMYRNFIASLGYKYYFFKMFSTFFWHLIFGISGLLIIFTSLNFKFFTFKLWLEDTFVFITILGDFIMKKMNSYIWNFRWICNNCSLSERLLPSW